MPVYCDLQQPNFTVTKLGEGRLNMVHDAPNLVVGDKSFWDPILMLILFDHRVTKYCMVTHLWNRHIFRVDHVPATLAYPNYF